MDRKIEFSQISFQSAIKDLSCQNCVFFHELAQALRLSVGTLRNWKYLGTITPIHSIGRRPHFHIDMVRNELMRKGKIKEGRFL